MRHRLPIVQESRLARIAERLAYAGVAVVLVAILVTRANQVDPLHGLAGVVFAVVLAAAAIATGLVAGIEIWRHGYLGLGRLARALTVAGLLLAYPAWLAAEALRLPVLNDITTDIIDPPVFSSSRAVLAARGGRIPPDIDPRRRTAQVRAYPALKTLVLENEPEEAFQLISRAVKQLKWRVIEEVRPDDRRGLGRIEAIDETRLMRFADDITIRLRWTGTETRIDIRSVSRIGRHDFGSNAARIVKLAEEITNPSE